MSSISNLDRFLSFTGFKPPQAEDPQLKEVSPQVLQKARLKRTVMVVVLVAAIILLVALIFATHGFGIAGAGALAHHFSFGAAHLIQPLGMSSTVKETIEIATGLIYGTLFTTLLLSYFLEKMLAKNEHEHEKKKKEQLEVIEEPLKIIEEPLTQTKELPHTVDTPEWFKLKFEDIHLMFNKDK